MANNLITISKIKSDLQANINENFSVLRLIYAVSLVLGYREVLSHYNLAGPITIEYITGSVVLLSYQFGCSGALASFEDV